MLLTPRTGRGDDAGRGGRSARPCCSPATRPPDRHRRGVAQLLTHPERARPRRRPVPVDAASRRSCGPRERQIERQQRNGVARTRERSGVRGVSPCAETRLIGLRSPTATARTSPDRSLRRHAHGEPAPSSAWPALLPRSPARRLELRSCRRAAARYPDRMAYLQRAAPADGPAHGVWRRDGTCRTGPRLSDRAAGPTGPGLDSRQPTGRRSVNLERSSSASRLLAATLNLGLHRASAPELHNSTSAFRECRQPSSPRLKFGDKHADRGRNLAPASRRPAAHRAALGWGTPLRRRRGFLPRGAATWSHWRAAR